MFDAHFLFFIHVRYFERIIAFFVSKEKFKEFIYKTN